ncbi:MAG: hypothetical protein B7Y47_14010 [Sphingomonas sp. 28-63-12]|nr:MAG: hypothetical protein B7Y47_14010 [Sphingomonas sp. 28-63-12]
MNAPVRVWHYDGQTAVRREPQLIAEGAMFRLVEGDWAGAPAAFADLIARDPIGGLPSYGLKHVPGWKIGFLAPPPPSLLDRLPAPRPYGGLIDRFGLWPAALVCALLAAIVVLLVIRTPALLARLVPPAIERQLGDAMVGDFGDRACTGADGLAALGVLKDRLGVDDPETEIAVVNIPITNAVTLPGGRIILFNGLLQNARSPDEIAGVIGHELGHVAHRDVLESLLRQLGLSVLLGGLDGNIGGYTNMLLSTAYSRDAETRADRFAIDMLNQRDISPTPTAAFFRRLEASEPGMKGSAATVLAYVSSHPISALRAQQFALAARDHTHDRPALDRDQWAALRSICKDNKLTPRTILRF